MLAAPLDVTFNARNVFQPDIIWISPQRFDRIVYRGIQGAPDLVVEILSPSTAKNDQERKFKVYEAEGVRDYWIIDPIDLSMEVWVSQNGKFVKLGVFSDQDTFYSPTLETNVPVNEFLKVD